MPEYIEHLLGYIDIKSLKPLKIVANPGNGGAGPVLNELAKYLPFEFIKINEIPDGTFPNGVPNPLWYQIARLRQNWCANIRLIWAWPGTAILTAAFCLMKKPNLLKAII